MVNRLAELFLQTIFSIALVRLSFAGFFLNQTR
jgi:hypothetical protein